MGYTHYWKFNPSKESEKEFELVIEDCQQILKNSGDIVIRGGHGIGLPEVSKTKICFNGDAATDNDYESFYFNVVESTDFDFCKTARRPYDLIVGAVLLSLSHRMTGFSFSSDGTYTENEWIPIFEFYEKIGLGFHEGEKNEIIHKINNG